MNRILLHIRDAKFGPFLKSMRFVLKCNICVKNCGAFYDHTICDLWFANISLPSWMDKRLFNFVEAKWTATVPKLSVLGALGCHLGFEGL